MTDPASPPPGTPLCALDAVPDGGARVVDVASGAARFSLIVARRGGAAHAFVNLCPHARWPLDTFDGRVLTADGAIVCAAHGASFDAVTGACLSGPARRGLTPARVRVADGQVLAG